VDVEAQSAVGGVVCGSRVDGNRWSGLRQYTEGTERSNAAGKLFGDVQRHGERRDYKYAADQLHRRVGVEPGVPWDRF
jgi:hypothetical protein